MQYPAAATLAAFALAVSMQQAHAQGDVMKGLVVARSACAECHTIRGEARSPAREAPSFDKLANTPGVNAMALRVALQTSHQRMPNFTLATADRDDVIAYIVSLKRRN